MRDAIQAVIEGREPFFDKEGITLFQGDCLEVLHAVKDRSVDLILCDLPYGTTACEWDSIIPLEPLWAHYKRVVKQKAAIVLTASQPFTSVLVMSNLKWFKYAWVWDKVRPSGFQIAKVRPMMRHEDVCVFGKGSVTYHPIMTKRMMRVQGRVCSSSKSSPLLYSDGLKRSYLLKYPQSILEVGKENSRLHPTQKPLALMDYLIRTYSNPGDLVLDNCFGSGTTALAARNLKRQFIGIEKEEQYCRVAVKRLQQPYNLSLDLEAA